MNWFTEPKAKHSARLLLLSATLCFLWLFPSAALAQQDAGRPGNGPENTAAIIPEYSILYDKLLTLEKEKKYIEALKVIPRIYAQEIPVESFYITLENKRKELLKSIAQKNIGFSFGSRQLTYNQARDLFIQYYLARPRSCNYRISVAESFDTQRFCYLMIVAEKSLATGTGHLPVTFSSRNGLLTLLSNSDPWLVAGTVFLARYQDKTLHIAPQIIQRWQDRPDLWDEECTTQALLYLAGQDELTMDRLEIENDDIRQKTAELKTLLPDESYVVPLLYDALSGKIMSANPSGLTLVRLKKNEEGRGEIRRWTGDKNQFSTFESVNEQKLSTTNAIQVSPGLYQIKFNSVSGNPPAGFYGKSMIAEVPPGKFVAIPIPLLPAL